MPLTDFLKSFLQQLPQNLQYAGTRVAPLMAPDWERQSQFMQQQDAALAASQQQQENWEKQFSSMDQARKVQEEHQRGQLMIEALRAGLRPAGAQQTQGGPGLNGGGNAPSFGAGGGQSASPAQAPSPDPSTSFGPNMYAQMFGMQGATARGPNAASQQQPGQITPSSRMPAMGGDSGAGGAIAPAAMNIPALADQ